MNLPQGWIEIKIGDIAQYINGKAFKPSEWEDSGLPIVRIQNLNDDNAKYNFSTKKFENKYKIKNGDLLFAWSASLGAYIWYGKDAWLNQHIFKVIPYSGIDKKFLYYVLVNTASLFYSKTHGSGMVHITKEPFESTKATLLPLPEQQRIVTKIDSLFSELDNGVTLLKTIKTKLAVYRQAVLKWAFEGKLTEEWRKKNSVNASVNIEEVPKSLTNDLLPLPEKWSYVFLSKLGDLSRGKSKHRPRNDPKLFKNGKYPFIQTGDVKAANKYIEAYNSQYGEFGLKQSKLWKVGTLCITIAANIAETAFLAIDACFPDSIVGFSADTNVVESKYVDYFIQSAKIKLWAFAPATAQKNINLQTLENMIIPYCPQPEQLAIVSAIESRLSVCEKLEQTIDQTLALSDSLRQSILKKAFEGRLVPQDPNDEPAEKLLERIRAEKAAVATGQKQTRKRGGK
jgi:type I restriction enzyme S subunit